VKYSELKKGIVRKMLHTNITDRITLVELAASLNEVCIEHQLEDMLDCRIFDKQNYPIRSIINKRS